MDFVPTEITLRDSRRALLRAATPDDAADHWVFLQRLRAATPFVVTAPDEAIPIEKLQEELAVFHDRPGALYLIALGEGPSGSGSPVVGDCVIQPFKARKMAHVANLGMGCDELWQGCGLGKAMLSAMIAYTEAHPVLQRLELGVMAHNTIARGLYRGLGFVEHGVHPGRFKQEDGGYSDEVMMGRWVGPDAPH